jgi:Fe-S cluster assembly protein SufD
MNAEIRPIRTAAESELAASFAKAKLSLPGTDAVSAVREAAFRRFQADGLPNRRVEEWKYTDLRALMREALPLARAPDAAAKLDVSELLASLPSIEARRVVFVNGVLAPELSDLTDLESGLAVRSLASVLAQDPGLADQIGAILPMRDGAVDLNTAFMGDGAVIEVVDGVALARPIHLVFANAGAEPASVFARSLAVIGKGARAMLVESHAGCAEHQVNSVLELKIGDGAHVDHVKVTGEGAGSLHLSSLIAAVGAQARFNEFLFTTGGSVVRNQLFVRFEREGTIAAIGGASLLKRRQHADITLVAEHAAPACTSRELFKSVLDEESRGIFQGKIIVQSHAQKTDAKMATHALLLSDRAEADNKPELEIFADDVQCGHGATAGALDEDLLFYLKARGIPDQEAEALLIQAFVGEAVEGIEHAGLRDALLAHVVAWLQRRG